VFQSVSERDEPLGRNYSPEIKGKSRLNSGLGLNSAAMWVCHLTKQ
jgi:hypothetical protein